VHLESSRLSKCDNFRRNGTFPEGTDLELLVGLGLLDKLIIKAKQFKLSYTHLVLNLDRDVRASVLVMACQSKVDMVDM